MELLKSVFFILTITIIATITHHSEGLFAGLNYNFDICGLKCGFGVNGAIPNACKYVKPEETIFKQTRGTQGCLSRSSGLFRPFSSLFKKKECPLKQLFSGFKSNDLCQRSPLLEINVTPTIEKTNLAKLSRGSSCDCKIRPPANPRIQKSSHDLYDYSKVRNGGQNYGDYYNPVVCY